jgi:DmsE family decaheme c-type cytochrome
MKHSKNPLVAALLGLGLMFGATMAAQAAEKKEYQDLVQKDDKVCTRCHDETEAYPVLEIGKTKHGTRADGRTPTCITCHGESKTHADKPEDAKERPKPDRSFTGQLLSVPSEDRVDRYFGLSGKRTATPVEERNGVCLGCHQGGKRIHWQMSAHDARGVACTSCHQIHAAHDKARDRHTQSEVCFTCHKDVRVQITKPSRHPIQEGKMACSDCHNPHGTAGFKMLKRDTVNDTCFQCHMEKRGPFLWNHQPVTEDCSLCHNPHGTTNDSMLKMRAPFLCQQCHEGTSHRGNIPSTRFGDPADEVGIGIALARGCVNCHTNIHGGSNPANNAASRTFRR